MGSRSDRRGAAFRAIWLLTILVVLCAAALSQARGYLVAVGGECDGPGHACTVGASHVPYGTTWADFVKAEPVRKIAMSWESPPGCDGVSRKGPWHVQWWDAPRIRSSIVNPDGSVNGGTKLVDFGNVGPGESSTRTFYLGPATNHYSGLVTYVGPNTQCAEFLMRGLSTNDLSLSGRVLGRCTKPGCEAKRPGVPDITIEVRGSRSLSTKTDVAGNYEVLLPRGHYTIEPVGIDAEPRVEHVQLKHNVRNVNFTAAAAGRLSLGSGLNFEVISFAIDNRNLTVTKLVDNSSAAILTDVARGTTFRHAKLEVYKPRTTRVAVTYSYSNMVIRSESPSSRDPSTELLKLEAQSVSVHR